MENIIQIIFYSFIGIECIMFLVQLNIVISRPQNSSRFEVLILLFLFLCYNFSSFFFPDNTLTISIFKQMVIGYITGILALSYYYYYAIKVLNLKLFKGKRFPIFLITLLASFVLVYGLSYFITNDLKISEKLFILIPIVIASFLLYNLGIVIKKEFKSLKTKTLPIGITLMAIYLGCTVIMILPILIIFEVSKEFNFAFVNIALIITYLAYYNDYLFQIKVEHLFLQKMGYYIEPSSDIKIKILTEFKNFGLTSRELEVAFLITKKRKYNEIADELFISPKTVSKHASNIFKKTNTIGKREFFQKYQSEDE